MDASFGYIVRWILAGLLIFALLQRSEALTWNKQPRNPTVVVEGVNSSVVSLEWTFGLDSGETLSSIFLKRARTGVIERTQIAVRSGSSSFTVGNEFQNKYRAYLPTTLELRNVNNNEEYSYIIEVNYNLNGLPTQKESIILVKVYVPPQIFVFPERQPRVSIGQNKTLTCNASGDPRPNITWTKDAVQVRQFNVSGYRLHLVNVQRNDVGTYRCTASNGYGANAISVSVFQVTCPSNGCQTKRVGFTITSEQYKDAYNNPASSEYRALESNITSAIASLYTQHPVKQLYQQSIISVRPGSIVAEVQLLFATGVADPLQPLGDQVAQGTLGPYVVDRELVINPTTPPATTPTGQTTGTIEGPSAGARTNLGLTTAELWGIIGGAIAFLLVIVIIILICCICRKKKNAGGASKAKSTTYTEADGYRMNKQPPSSGLGTASPAYVEARMYAPANSSRKQDDQPKPMNYADLSFDKSSSRPPPQYGTGTEYSEMSPEKRPPPAGGGGGQSGEGFQMWC